jgi:hypothetical protein
MLPPEELSEKHAWCLKRQENDMFQHVPASVPIAMGTTPPLRADPAPDDDPPV